jgi:hypothetical protein
MGMVGMVVFLFAFELLQTPLARRKRDAQGGIILGDAG